MADEDVKKNAAYLEALKKTWAAGSQNPQPLQNWTGQQPRQSACPNCGYCPHCGRGGDQVWPWHYAQPYPYGGVSPQPWNPSWKAMSGTNT